MKAAVCRAFGEPLVVEEVTLSPPGPGEIRVRLGACAICHSDIHYAEGAWGGQLPAVYGHEAAGEVVAAGEGVIGFAPGDRVVVTLIRSCGECAFCAEGNEVFCERAFSLDARDVIHDHAGHGLHQAMRTGAFAEEVVVHASQAVVIPPDMPYDVASLIACGVLTGFGAVTNTAGVRRGESVAVIGTGGVGINTLQAARHVGASPVIAIDLSEDKLAAAPGFGATHTVNPARRDAQAAVLELTRDRGVHYAFVTVGAKKAIEQAAGLVRKGGAIVIVGMPASGVMAEYDPSTLAAYGIRIVGSKMGSARIARDIPMLVDLYRRGELLLDPLISGRYALGDINEAIASVNRGEALRNVIVF